MEQNVSAELKQIAQELRCITADVERIAQGVRSDFRGIGSEYCAEALGRVAGEYRAAAKSLEQIEVRTSAPAAASAPKPTASGSKDSGKSIQAPPSRLLDFI